MKKLCAVVLFAFLASFFAAGVAFAAVAPVISMDSFVQPALHGVPALLKQSPPMLMSTDIASTDVTSHSKESWDFVANFNDGQVRALEVFGEGVAVSRDVAKDIAGFLFDNLDVGLDGNGLAGAGDHLVPVVVWSADTGGGTSVEPLVAVMFMLESEDAILHGYYGKRAKDIFAVKVLGDGLPDGRVFTQVYSAADITDHTSAIVKVVGSVHTVLAADEVLDVTKEYALLVAVRKGATNWDNSKASGEALNGNVDFANIIIDPMFISTVYPFEPFGYAITDVRPDVVDRTSFDVMTDKANIDEPSVFMAVKANLENSAVNDMVWVTEAAIEDLGYAKENVQRFPVVSADIGSGKPDTVYVVQMLRTEAPFIGKAVQELKVVTGGVNSVVFDMVDDPSKFADGKSMILKKASASSLYSSSSNKFVNLKLTDKIEEGGTYWVAIAVKDGGDFDYHKTINQVITPFFVAATGSAKPEPTNPFTAVPAIDGLPTGLATPDATVVFANLTETGLTTAAQGAVNTAGTEVNGGVQYYMSSTVASAILAAHEADLGTSPISQATVPVMKAALPTGTSAAAFAFPIASSFAGKTVGDVKFYKAVNGTAADAKEFELVQTGAAITDGKFAIVTSAGVVKTASETVATGDLVVYAIADGGDFDLDGAVNSSISDPVLVACDNTAAPTSGGDSSSGCSVGGFAPATLLLLAPLFLLLKK